jgi:hypothetical protein
MNQYVNVVIAVDVIGALSDRTLLNGNLIMMDNGPYQSSGQGTPELRTVCRPGQIIQWVIYAVDLQTPVEIKSIAFLDAGNGLPTLDGEDSGSLDQVAGGSSESEHHGLDVWSGVVPPWVVPGVEYRYRLALQMYEGENSVMSIDSCSLQCL